MQLKVHTDGGSLNNPGKAASAFLIYDATSGKLLYSEQKYIGIASNNVAEYTALMMALEFLVVLVTPSRHSELGSESREILKRVQDDKIEKITFVADSELMVRQVNGIYKVKNADIKPLFNRVKALEMSLGIPLSYTHVLREHNAQADALVKKALGR